MFARVALCCSIALALANCKPRSKSATFSEGGEAFLPTLSHPVDYEKMRGSPDADDSYVKYLWDFGDGRDQFYFMNTAKYPFHAQFVGAHLPHYSAGDYNNLGSFPEPKKISSGGVYYLPEFSVVNPPSGTNEIYSKPGVLAFSLYRDLEAPKPCESRAYTPEEMDEVVKVFNRLKTAASFVESRIVYIACPQEALKNTLAVKGKGIPIFSFAITATNPTYNVAKAYGYLKNISPADLEGGEYTHKDILVLSELPLDIGPISGLISTKIQVPGSHVRLRAKNLNIPNVFFEKALTDSKIQSNVGKLIEFETKPNGIYTIKGAEQFPGGESALKEAAETYWKSRVPKLPEPVADLKNTNLRHWREEGATHEEVRSYGAKATNFAMLDNELTERGYNRQEFRGSFMIPFSYYNQHVSQNIKAGLCAKVQTECKEKYGDACSTPNTLCAAHEGKPLKVFLKAMTTQYGAEMIAKGSVRKAFIKTAQELIKETKTDQALVDALVEHIRRTYPDTRRIRFRSSTNAEDLPGLSGAGLYQSFSGCVEDTVNDQGEGGACVTPLEKERMNAKIKHYQELDPEKYKEAIEELQDDLTKKRKIGKTIGKVYASLWNEKAFLSRDYFHIDHHKIYMGVLVHPSFIEESANGVAILERKDGGKFELELVTQKDDISVTNPELEGAIPENVIVYMGGGNDSVTYRSFSNQVPAGQLLLKENELKDVRNQIMATYEKLTKEYGQDYSVRLDFEYILNRDRLVYMKQARPL
ncbi:MAG: PEP/pyruvate-binding domain-containing protein [Oligoflexales bacterium]